MKCSNAPGAVLSFDNGHYSSSGNQLFWNQSTTKGYGKIADLIIQNDGLIDANVTGKSLSVRGPQSATHSLRNQGTMRATNGGLLYFSNWRHWPYRGGILNHYDGQQAGTIEAWGDSTVYIERTTITGGRITTSTEGGVEEGQIRFSSLITLDRVELDAEASFSGNAVYRPVLRDSTFANKKTLSLDGGFLQISGTNILSGGGVFKLSHNDSVFGLKNEDLGYASPTPTFVNVDNTVLVSQNSSATFGEEMVVENRGIFEANGPNAQLTLESRDPHIIDLYNGKVNWTNSGVIQAVNGGKIIFDHDGNDPSPLQVIQNYGLGEQGNVLPGVIQAGTGSEVHLTAVSGGIVQAAAGGVIHIENQGYLGADDTPTDLHLLGRIETDDITLGGTIRNDGQLVVSGAISHTNLYYGATYSAPPLRLIGNGELQLDGTLLTPNSTFLNGPDHTIIGSGEIRSEGSFFTNEGRIEANENNTLTITHTGPAFLFQQRGELISSGNGSLNIEFEEQFTNRGIVRVATDATTHFIGDLSSSSHQLVNAGGAEIVVDGQLFVKNSDLINEAGATVKGDGQIELVAEPLLDPRFINHGTLTPGHSIGQLTILGDFQQSPTGDLEIELGGTALNEFDSLAVRSADLAGLLEVSLVDLGDGAFAPELGDSFEILELSNGPLTGEFDTFSLPTLAADLLWGIQYNPTSVVLEILAPLQADLDADGDVDGSDFLALQRTDPSLLPQWQAVYGSRVIISSPVASSQAVPEPTSCVLCLTALLGCCLSRRRRSDG